MRTPFKDDWMGVFGLSIKQIHRIDRKSVKHLTPFIIQVRIQKYTKTVKIINTDVLMLGNPRTRYWKEVISDEKGLKFSQSSKRYFQVSMRKMNN